MVGPLSRLDEEILRAIQKGEPLDQIAKRLGVPGGTLGKEIGNLQLGGYLADDGTLTPKGHEALK